MVKFLQTLIGLVFFGTSLFVLIIKNHPSDYLLSIEQEVAYPPSCYIDYLTSKQGNEFWQHHFKENFTALHEVFLENQIQLLTEEKRTIEFTIPTSKGFELIEKWSFDQEKNTTKVSYTYSAAFSVKLYLFFNSIFHRTIKDLAESRLAASIVAIEKQFGQHRWEYLGEQPQALSYYIAIEGSSDWSSLSKNIAVAQSNLIAFAQKNEIVTLGDAFVLYPLIKDRNVFWRAAIKTDRYYNTNSETIKCRRYKGGNSIVLVHFGDFTYLKDSWLVLNDSLQAKQQSYPAIQIETVSKKDTSNPLKWETTLILPIQ